VPESAAVSCEEERSIVYSISDRANSCDRVVPLRTWHVFTKKQTLKTGTARKRRAESFPRQFSPSVFLAPVTSLHPLAWVCAHVARYNRFWDDCGAPCPVPPGFAQGAWAVSLLSLFAAIPAARARPVPMSNNTSLQSTRPPAFSYPFYPFLGAGAGALVSSGALVPGTTPGEQWQATIRSTLLTLQSVVPPCSCPRSLAAYPRPLS